MAGPLDELVSGLDPVDVATLFGRFKSAVPLGMAAFSRGLNQGEDEALLKKYGTRPLPPMVEPSAQEMQRRAIEEFELRYPTPELRAAILEQMRANRRGEGYDPSTATRRVDFAPQNQPDYKGPVATPSTGKRRFQAGGGVKKTVQQMKDELMLGGKGKPVKETVDLSRRSFFRLPESKSFPLAKIDDTALDKLEQKYAKQGQAPAVTTEAERIAERKRKDQAAFEEWLRQEKADFAASFGPAKELPAKVVKSIAETPISRRTVLKAAGTQALQGMLPSTGMIGDVAKAVNPVQSVVKQVVAPGLTNPWAMAMSLLKQGKTEKEVADILARKGVKPSDVYDESTAPFEGDLSAMIDRITNPSGYLAHEFADLKRPSEALSELTHGHLPSDVSPMQWRGTLRQMREANPDAYRGMLNTAKDLSTSSAETAVEMGLEPKWIDKFMRGQIEYKDLPKSYQNQADRIMSGWESGGDY